MARTETIASETLMLLRILKRIPDTRWISSTELGQELAESGTPVARRRLQRLLQALCTLEEFCVQCDSRTKPFAYRRLTPDSDLSRSRLKPEECLVLRIAEERLGPLFPEPVTASLRPLFERARRGLKESPAGDPSARWLRKVLVSPDTLPVIPPTVLPRIFSAVSRALWRDTKLELEYGNAAGETHAAVVSPLGIVLQGERVYLVCRYDGHDNVRHLALHRIRTARVLPFAAERPKDFSLEAYAAGRHINFSNGRKIRLSFESSDPLLRRFLEESPLSRDQRLEDCGDGAWRACAVIEDSVLVDAWLARWSAGSFRSLRREPAGG